MAEVDGKINCDRCETQLDGYGVIYGMIMSHLDGEMITELIYCYTNGCRDIAVDGMINNTDGRARCSTCGESITGIVDAALGSDVDHLMAFCYRNGHRDQVVDQGEL